MFDTKYGKIMRASPQSSGMIAPCFLPYTKKPSPTDPKTMLQSNDDVSTGDYPFTTPTGRNRTTFRASPASWTTWTTRSTSL